MLLLEVFFYISAMFAQFSVSNHSLRSEAGSYAIVVKPYINTNFLICNVVSSRHSLREMLTPSYRFVSCPIVLQCIYQMKFRVRISIVEHLCGRSPKKKEPSKPTWYLTKDDPISFYCICNSNICLLLFGFIKYRFIMFPLNYFVFHFVQVPHSLSLKEE